MCSRKQSCKICEGKENLPNRKEKRSNLKLYLESSAFDTTIQKFSKYTRMQKQQQDLINTWRILHLELTAGCPSRLLDASSGRMAMSRYRRILLSARLWVMIHPTDRPPFQAPNDSPYWRGVFLLTICFPVEDPLLSQPKYIMLVSTATVVSVLRACSHSGYQCWPCPKSSSPNAVFGLQSQSWWIWYKR